MSKREDIERVAAIVDHVRATDAPNLSKGEGIAILLSIIAHVPMKHAERDALTALTASLAGELSVEVSERVKDFTDEKMLEVLDVAPEMLSLVARTLGYLRISAMETVQNAPSTEALQ